MKKTSSSAQNTAFVLSTVWKYISKIFTVAFSILFTVFIIAVITGVIMASALAIYVKKYIDPTFDIPDLQSNIELSTSLYYDDGTGPEGAPNWVELEEDRLYASENRTWVPYDKIPENLVNAFIAIEDKRFRTHNGVDYRRTIGAFLELIQGNTSYGGSTITQQLIKNNTKEDDTTIQRKIQEILRALDLEKRRSKEEILEMYLNTIYLSQGQYGVQAAAREYFGKDVTDLTLTECAAIASITQYPTKWDPKQNPENNRKRRTDVLWEMWKQGLITEEEYNVSCEEELVLVDEENILTSIFLIVCVGVFFMCGAIYSFRKYSHYNFFKAIWHSIVTAIHLVAVWFPIAMFIIFKIIFTQKTMDWGKTQHGVSNVEGVQ